MYRRPHAVLSHFYGVRVAGQSLLGSEYLFLVCTQPKTFLDNSASAYGVLIRT